MASIEKEIEMTITGITLTLTVEEARQVFAAVAVCQPDKRDRFLEDRFDFPTTSLEQRVAWNRLMDNLYDLLGPVLGSKRPNGGF